MSITYEKRADSSASGLIKEQTMMAPALISGLCGLPSPLSVIALNSTPLGS